MSTLIPPPSSSLRSRAEPRASSPSKQSRWLAERVGVYRTADRVVHVRGEDARSWLNGQISNDVRTLSGDEARYAVALTLKGRIVSDLWALEEAEGMAIVVPGARAEAALARFEQFIIMEDVELLPDDELVVVTVQGPSAAQVIEVLPPAVRRYSCARLGQVGFDCWLPSTQLESALAVLIAKAELLGGGSIDDAGWAEAHVTFGVPRVELDFGEDTYPQEAGLGARALSFGKGCYLGQEVVYMLENRGQLARRLVQLELPPGAAVAHGSTVVDAEGKRLGEVTSAAPGPEHELALAYVKRAHAEPESTVWVAGSPARVRLVVGASETTSKPDLPA